MLTPAPDIDLWNAAIGGNRDAFGELFRRHYGLLYQYGCKICPDSELVEDNIQELFAETWQRKPAQPILSVKAYLLQSLKFKLYRSFRKKGETISLGLAAEEPFELSHETMLIDRQESAERAGLVLDALNRLPVRQKEIIYLRIYKGLSYEEISVIMELNYQVVRNLLCQALKNFRKGVTKGV